MLAFSLTIARDRREKNSKSRLATTAPTISHALNIQLRRTLSHNTQTLCAVVYAKFQTTERIVVVARTLDRTAKPFFPEYDLEEK